MAAFDRAELDELKRRLDDCAERLFQELLGDPTTRRRNEYRWGRKGSAQLIRRKVGWRWRTYETGESGSILDAIMSVLGLDFAAAVAWAKDWLGDRKHRGKAAVAARACRCRRRQRAKAAPGAGDMGGWRACRRHARREVSAKPPGHLR